MIRRGVSYACCFYGTGYGNGFPDESYAKVSLISDGSITLFTACADVGQGAVNAMKQICGEALHIPLKNIKIINNTTNNLLDSGTAAASRQTYNTGNAVLKASKKLKEAMDKIKINNLYKDEKAYFREIYDIMVENKIETEYTGYFKAETSEVNVETGSGNPYNPYTYGIQKAVVTVDDETGKVDVIELTSILDAGKAINPQMVTAQMEGGCAMGIGYALMEETEFHNGEIKNKNFSNYIMPTSMDVPKINTIIVESLEETGPYGAKGIGEAVMIPTAPAIANAIYDACGVRILNLPITCDKLLKKIKEKNLRGDT